VALVAAPTKVTYWEVHTWPMAVFDVTLQAFIKTIAVSIYRPPPLMFMTMIESTRTQEKSE
jgi:hypothetical protein